MKDQQAAERTYGVAEDGLNNPRDNDFVTAPHRAAFAFLAVLPLAGCLLSNGGVTIPPGGDDLAPCPIKQIRVEDLAAIGEPGCTLEGSTLIYPTGVIVEIQPVGVASGFTSSDDPASYSHLNWGVPGVGAAHINADHTVTIWATTPQAYDLQRQQLRLEGDLPH